MIFVGYGVQAPEFQWDDFKGVDVRGKVVVMLVNDPPVPDPSTTLAKLDPQVCRRRCNDVAITVAGRTNLKRPPRWARQAASSFTRPTVRAIALGSGPRQLERGAV